MKMNLTGAIEILKLHKHTTDKFKHSVGDQYVSDAIDTVVSEVEKPPITERDMHLNMQYYMEYCQMKGYVTPMEWIEKHKHF